MHSHHCVLREAIVQAVGQQTTTHRQVSPWLMLEALDEVLCKKELRCQAGLLQEIQPQLPVWASVPQLWQWTLHHEKLMLVANLCKACSPLHGSARHHCKNAKASHMRILLRI